MTPCSEKVARSVSKRFGVAWLFARYNNILTINGISLVIREDMSTFRDTRNAGTQQKSIEEAKIKKGPLFNVAPGEASGEEGAMNLAEILQELKELSKENQELLTDTKASLSRLETSVTDLKQRRVEETETRVGVAEDTSQHHERVLRHLVRRKAALTDLCDDLQN